MFPVILVRLVRISAYLSQGGAGPRPPGTGLLSRVRRGIVTKEAAGRAVTLK